MHTSNTGRRAAIAVTAAGIGATVAGAFRSRAVRASGLQDAVSAAETELVSQCVSSWRLGTNVARAVAANEKAFRLIERIEQDEVASEMLAQVYDSTMAIVCATTDLIGREGVSVRHMKAIRTAVGPVGAEDGIRLYDPDATRPEAGADLMLEARRRAESLLGKCEAYRRTRGLGWRH